MHGYKVAENYKDIGALRIDYNSTYGRYVIQLMCQSSGVTHIMGHDRMTAKEFYNSLDFANRVKFAEEEKKRLSNATL